MYLSHYQHGFALAFIISQTYVANSYNTYISVASRRNLRKLVSAGGLGGPKAELWWWFSKYKTNNTCGGLKCILFKSINFDLPPIFNHWFTFSSDSYSYQTSRSSKGLLKVKTVNTKKYGREAMTNNAVSSWNNIQNIFPSHVLRDLSYSRLKSLLVKYFLKSYSNNA